MSSCKQGSSRERSGGPSNELQTEKHEGHACPVPALALFSAILQPGLSRVNGAGERRLASQCSIERPKTKEGREQLQARLLHSYPNLRLSSSKATRLRVCRVVPERCWESGALGEGASELKLEFGLELNQGALTLCS